MTRSRSPRALLLALVAGLALVLSSLGAPTATARPSEGSPAAAAAQATAEVAARPGSRPRNRCRVVKKRVTKRVTRRVTARRGEQAGRRVGKRAGQRAYRRCLARKQATTPTGPTGPTPRDPGAPGGAAVTTDACVTSVPDPGTTAPVEICYSLFRPAGASATSPVPMVMHSHGWGGSRTTDAAAFAPFLERGYGVLSFDQRGFGESGGQAYVENPAVEGQDVRRLIDLVSDLPWVEQDGPGDPRMGAIGGSYGGGYQFLAAFESMRDTGGTPIFDALAPEITWYDLEESLAPSGVVRTAWALALTAAAQPSMAMPEPVIAGLAEGVAQGSFPDSLRTFFAQNGPKFHTGQGRRLDIPVLFGQGTTDGLFPLEQGLQNFDEAITDDAREQSIFVGYNGGHVLPSVFPMGISLTSDPCSAELTDGTFEDLTLRFFDENLKGRDTGLTGYGRYHLATPQNTCLSVDSVDATTTTAIDDPIVNTTGPAGAPVGTLVARGPITLAGTPYLSGDVTALVPDSRLFVGLAVGTSAADATPIQNNMLPLVVDGPVTGESRPRIDLPSVATEIPAGQNLYLLTTATQDTFAGMGSRVPGVVTIDNAVVHLPTIR